MYALVNKSDGTLIKKTKRLPTINNTIPLDLDGSLQWLPVVKWSQPDYDKSTHRLVKEEARISSQWIVGWVPKELTGPERASRIKSDYANLLDEGAEINGKVYPMDTAAIAKANGTFINRGALKYPRRIPANDGTFTRLYNQKEVIAHYAALVGQYEALADMMMDELEALGNE